MVRTNVSAWHFSLYINPNRSSFLRTVVQFLVYMTTMIIFIIVIILVSTYLFVFAGTRLATEKMPFIKQQPNPDRWENNLGGGVGVGGGLSVSIASCSLLPIIWQLFLSSTRFCSGFNRDDGGKTGMLTERKRNLEEGRNICVSRKKERKRKCWQSLLEGRQESWVLAGVK